MKWLVPQSITHTTTTRAFVAPGSAAVTSTAVFDAVALAGGAFATTTGLELSALDKMVNVRKSSQRNKLGAQKYDVVIAVSAVDIADADEEYTFNVYVRCRRRWCFRHPCWFAYPTNRSSNRRPVRDFTGHRNHREYR
jgi:hypothetical protein